MRLEGPLVDEEKEKAKIAWENKMLAIFMPVVGAVAFILGLVGFILAVQQNIAIAVFLLVLALLGLGGIAYGVFALFKKMASKRKKEIKEPDEQ